MNSIAQQQIEISREVSPVKRMDFQKRPVDNSILPGKPLGLFQYILALLDSML
jgi:hypothetical protein